MRLILLLLFGVLSEANSADFKSLEVTYESGIYRVETDVELDADIHSVRKVITDFNHLHWISGAIRKSQRLDSPAPDIVAVYTLSKVCFLIFCRNIEQIQHVDMGDSNRIVATALPEYSNVKQSVAIWKLIELPDNRTQLQWSLLFEPDFFVPPLIGPAAIKSGLREEGQDTVRGIEKLARERMQRK